MPLRLVNTAVNVNPVEQCFLGKPEAKLMAVLQIKVLF